MKTFTESVTLNTWMIVFSTLSKHIEKKFNESDIGIFDYKLEPHENVTIKYYLKFYPEKFDEIKRYLTEISNTIESLEFKDCLTYKKTVEMRSDIGENYNVVILDIDFKKIQNNEFFDNILKSTQGINKYKL